MLCSPDPPNHSEEDFCLDVVSDIPLDVDGSEEGSTEDSADELTNYSQFVYELLPQDVISGINNENGNTESEEDFFESDDVCHQMMNSEEATYQNSNKERTDIEINDEEVRAAMQNVVLPPSSIPPWAVSVPESQWTSFLLSRISTLNSNIKS